MIENQSTKLKEDIKFHSLSNDTELDLIININNYCFEGCLNLNSTDKTVKFNINEKCLNSCLKAHFYTLSHSNKLEININKK